MTLKSVPRGETVELFDGSPGDRYYVVVKQGSVRLSNEQELTRHSRPVDADSPLTITLEEDRESVYAFSESGAVVEYYVENLIINLFPRTVVRRPSDSAQFVGQNAEYEDLITEEVNDTLTGGSFSSPLQIDTLSPGLNERYEVLIQCVDIKGTDTPTDPTEVTIRLTRINFASAGNPTTWNWTGTVQKASQIFDTPLVVENNGDDRNETLYIEGWVNHGAGGVDYDVRSTTTYRFTDLDP